MEAKASEGLKVRTELICQYWVYVVGMVLYIANVGVLKETRLNGKQVENK
jgi:hypothetical protein